MNDYSFINIYLYNYGDNKFNKYPIKVDKYECLTSTFACPFFVNSSVLLNLKHESSLGWNQFNKMVD